MIMREDGKPAKISDFGFGWSGTIVIIRNKKGRELWNDYNTFLKRSKYYNCDVVDIMDGECGDSVIFIIDE